MAPTAPVRRLIAQQQVRAQGIRRMIARWRDRPEGRVAKALIENGIDKLKGYWTEYRLAHLQIAGRNTAATEPYMVDREFEEVEMEIDECEEEMVSQLAELEGLRRRHLLLEYLPLARLSYLS